MLLCFVLLLIREEVVFLFADETLTKEVTSISLDVVKMQSFV